MGRFEDMARAARFAMPEDEAAYRELEMRLGNQAAQDFAELHAVTTCHECSRLYSRDEWRALPLFSIVEDEYTREERRNCGTVLSGQPCGARLAVVTLVKRRYQPGAIDTITVASQHLVCSTCLLRIQPGDMCVRRDCPLTPKPETLCTHCHTR